MPEADRQSLRNGRALRVVLTYALFAALWILLSDKFLEWLAQDTAQLTLLSTFKGWFFVAATSLLLYWLIRREREALGMVFGDIQGASLESVPWFRNPRLLSLLLIIVALTSAAVVQNLNNHRETELARLHAIADLKTTQIEDWLRHRQADVEYLQASTYYAGLYRRWLVDGDEAAGFEFTLRIQDYLKNRDFAAAMLHDAGGRHLWGSSEKLPHAPPALMHSGAMGPGQREVMRIGPYLQEPSGEAYLDFVVPLTLIDPVPFLILHADPTGWLYQTLEKWPVPSVSGESLLFRREGDQVLFLNELRHTHDSALKLRVPVSAPTILASQVLRGEVQAGEPIIGTDYRDRPVVGTFNRVEGTDWYLIAKMDRAEIYAAAIKEAIWIGLVGLLGLFMTATGYYLLRQRQQLLVSQSIQALQTERLHTLNLLNAIAESSDDLIFAKDLQGRYTLFNRAAREKLGLVDATVIGRGDHDLFPREMAQRLVANDRQVLEKDGPLIAEEEIHFPSGEMAVMQTTKAPLRDADGNCIGLFGIARDISEQKRFERSLLESRDSLNMAEEIAHLGSWVLDHGSQALSWSDESYRIMGLEPGSVEPDYPLFLSLVHPDDRDLVDRAFSESVTEGRSGYEITHRVIDPHSGRERVILERCRHYTDESGRIFRSVGMAQDITERKRFERKLLENEARFRQLADAMPQLVWTADAQGVVDYYNSRAVHYDGFKPKTDGSWDWHPILHKEDVEPTVTAWQASVSHGIPYQCQHRVRMADGVYRWHLSRAEPVRDDSGRTVRWFGTATDIHDLKLAEQALQEADRRKNEFLATLAHELRNPLAPIRNAVEILKLQEAPQPGMERARDIIDRQLRHMVRLIDDLMEMSRITRGKLHLRRERVTLGSVLEQALEAARPRIEQAGHALEMELPAEEMLLHADPVRLTQVFLNLLNNAAKYTEPGGRIRLSVRRNDGHARVSIRDNGIGIAAENLPHIFELFTQEASAQSVTTQGGLGIGLSLAQGLVRMHGGTIEARSEGRGKGSEFIVRLPLIEAGKAVSGERSEGTQERLPLQALRVLVVDDQQDIRDSLALLLRIHGHEVEVAADGAAAVSVAEQFRPEVILMDIGMPKMDGYEACLRIRRQPWGKSMAIHALTGWGQKGDQRKAIEAGFDGHLVKPVEPNAVLHLLAEAQRE